MDISEREFMLQESTTNFKEEVSWVIGGVIRAISISKYGSDPAEGETSHLRKTKAQGAGGRSYGVVI